MGLRALLERRSGSPTMENMLIGSRDRRVVGGPSGGESEAMRHSAIWRGAAIYADLISTLPFAAYREINGVSSKVSPTPSLIDSPAVSVKPIAWRAQVVRSLVLRGNAYGLILTRDRNGYPTTVELQHPDVVAAKFDPKTLETEWRIGGNKVAADDVWHCAINEPAGTPFGLSMIEHAAQSIYGGLSAGKYSNEFFAGGGHPSAILATEQDLTREQAEQAKQSWMKARTGAAGEPAVLGAGWDYTPIQVSPKDALFVESMQASVNDIARFLGLPPELLGSSSGDSLTYATVEGRALDLLKFSINPVLRRLEEALSMSLPQPWFVKANRAALLEMTTLERYRAHHIALADGWRNRDEVRGLEDLPPLPDGQGGTFRDPKTSTSAVGGAV